MKSIVKAFFILIAVFSVVGIFLIGFYYIKKNISLFTKLFKEVGAGIEDYELTPDEIDRISDESVRIVKIISKDIENDLGKGKVESFVKESVVQLPIEGPKKVKAKSRKAYSKPVKESGLNSRQSDILNYIRNNSEAKMSNVSKMFAEVTPRTLRRDLGKLEQMGFVRQEGKTRDAVYKII